MMDDADAIAAKIRKAKSDADVLPEAVEGLAGRPEADNLVGIYGALADLSKEQVLAEFGGKGFGAFKPALAEVAVAKLAPIGEAMRRFMNDPAEVDRILARGAERAALVAEPVLDETRKLVGFWRGHA